MEIHFSYWLAGLIDGDGYLGVCKKNYVCCEITVGDKQLNLLSLVKKNLGGTIKKRKNVVKIYPIIIVLLKKRFNKKSHSSFNYLGKPRNQRYVFNPILFSFSVLFYSHF